MEASRETTESDLLEFSKFDINRVLKHGERLVGSSGAEYDLPDEDLIGEFSKVIKHVIILRKWQQFCFSKTCFDGSSVIFSFHRKVQIKDQ